MIKVVFQGDSITDADRAKQNGADLGRGYALRVASKLGLEKPGAYEFFNRGVSGDRVANVYARIKCDLINLKPDVVSILVGVNDAWQAVSTDCSDDAAHFEKIYTMLMEEILEALPDVKIMLMEPFVLQGQDAYPIFRAEVEQRAAAVRRIAEKFGLVFIPTQEKLDNMAAAQSPAYWITDGVHPSPCGHEFLAREWIDAYKKHFE